MRQESGTEAERLAYDTTGLPVLSTWDVTSGSGQGSKYTWGGSAWVKTHSEGERHVAQTHLLAASVETRIMRAVGDNLTTSRVAVGAATPTVADGSGLILFNTFGNTPKSIIVNSSRSGSGRHFLGWVLAVKYATALAAATAINAAYSDTGAPRSLATPVQNDADTGVIFIPPECSGLLYRQSTEITSVYGAPLVETGVDATGDAMLAQLSFRP